jgi:hypothetical protein
MNESAMQLTDDESSEVPAHYDSIGRKMCMGDHKVRVFEYRFWTVYYCDTNCANIWLNTDQILIAAGFSMSIATKGYDKNIQ